MILSFLLLKSKSVTMYCDQSVLEKVNISGAKIWVLSAETGHSGGILLQHFRKNVLPYGNVPLNALSDVKILNLYCVSFYSR